MLGSLSSLDAAADGSYVTHLNRSIHAHLLDAHIFFFPNPAEIALV